MALNRKEIQRVRTEESQARVGSFSPDILFVSKAKRELNQGRYSERKRHPNLGRVSNKIETFLLKSNCLPIQQGLRERLRALCGIRTVSKKRDLNPHDF
ncbi:conserved hypothetical protein [Ricinus communis]|uniref:Uncharacterized protein n=1 Tax=Ricinus communis TaxID=3988 RepID=B9RX08_RICCO|nr:conserved hypothetical protein [Ricinus communis]